MKMKNILSSGKNILLAIQRYKNWREIVISIIKGRENSTAILKNGIQIDAPEDGELLSIIQEVFFENVYTPIHCLSIEHDDIVVDIGANIGVFSLFAAFRTQNTIYAFEPYHGNIEFLNRNIFTNGLYNIITYGVAVCDKIGSTKLFLSESSGGHLLFDHNIKGKLEKYVEVPTTTLQHIMDDNNLKQIDFLKLDCEGSESMVLISTPIAYLRRVRKISMEFHDNVSQFKHDYIQRFLEKAGFVTTLNWNGHSPFGYIYGKRID